ncbi:putative amidohydrolase YtcJ [Bradyrhizobium sp. USDA 326]|uniref:hypothetical protein n=1 Tax=unclassified Bradyrhizobium TaxID=2631580 RepID=UPI000F536A1B|nr:hypothetical protein [Bradyrhizobium sp. RP6]RQH15240.1 hypothetical protein EHH60_08815 [Bradyrhizobium sp. RP6]
MSGRSQSIRFVNGRIYRDASDRIPAATLVTQNGAIGFVGPQDEAPSADATVDLCGATVIPGVTDAHIHLFGIAAGRLHISKAVEVFN